MSDSVQPLLSVASSISDGRPVDWQDRDLQPLRDDERQVLGRMRDVERIASFHREWLETSSSEPTPVRERWGHLQLLERVGHGSFGEVHRAFDTKLERQVALKLLRFDRGAQIDGRNAVAFVLEEGRRLARVHHQNVVTVYGADDHDGRVGLWMELVNGKTLAQVLDEQGPFGAREATIIGLDLCRALAAVHHAGLLHRDIKPQNVMRESGGRILLMDFGAGVESRGSSKTSSPAGTPLFMAPEVLEGAEASAQSDIYALGVLLYYLVTKSYPVHASEMNELVSAHRQGSMKQLRDARPDLPLAFVQVVDRALAPNPRNRFASAGEMEQALAGALARGLSRFAKAALVATVAIAVAALGFALWPSPETNAYTVQATLLMRHDGLREPLKQGDRVAVGDELGLEFKSSRSLYVYVLNEDEEGAAFVLFPLADGSEANPLPPSTESRWLPGYEGQQERAWPVTSAGGKEHFIIVASPEPLPELESTAELSTEQKTKFASRGARSTVSGPPSRRLPQTKAARTFEGIELLTDKAEQAIGVWKRHIELENPGS